MDRKSDCGELVKALETCLLSADALGLAMVGIHISHAIDLLRAEDLTINDPPTTVE